MSKTKIFLLLLVALLLTICVFFVIKRMVQKVGDDINTFYEPQRKAAKGMLLEDIDFTDGDYVLYIKHKEHGEFIVTDEQALQKNQDSLQVRISLANYLPGEGDRSYGVTLFKDTKEINSKHGGLFKIFEIGTLHQYGIPVEKKRFDSVKHEVQEKITELKSDKNAFITYQSEFPDDDKEFHFRIHFPSIAVPVTVGKDETGYERITSVKGFPKEQWDMKKEAEFENQWKAQITACIAQKLGKSVNYDLNVSHGYMSNSLLFDVTDNSWEQNLKHKDGSLLYINDFMYYDFEAYIGANKTDATYLLSLDYSDCLSETDRNKPALLERMKELVAQSNRSHLSVDAGEVELVDYKDEFAKSKNLYEQEYSVLWIVIK